MNLGTTQWKKFIRRRRQKPALHLGWGRIGTADFAPSEFFVWQGIRSVKSQTTSIKLNRAPEPKLPERKTCLL